MKSTANIVKHIDISFLVLILSVSAVLAYGYFDRVDRPNFDSRLELHNQIIDGTAPSPYRYRVLVPFIAEALTQGLSVAIPAKPSFFIAYALYDVLAITFLLVLLFYWLKTWFSDVQALIGVLFVAGTMPIALQDHFYQPWSLLEAGLFTAALIAIQKRRYWLLVTLVTLASFNRETALFIPIAFLLSLDLQRYTTKRSKDDWKSILLFGGLVIIWAAIFWGLRHLLGTTQHVETIEGILAKNLTTTSLFYAFVNGSLFLGGWWLFALFGLRYAPQFVKRVALIVPVYLLTILIWGVWYEVRLLMPLYPIFLSLGLSFIFLKERKTN